MVYKAVCYLRKPLPAPSQSWLHKLIKQELVDFHFITTKPIAQQRTYAQEPSIIIEWFEKYTELVLQHYINPKSI
jgi:hypothetical protein